MGNVKTKSYCVILDYWSVSEKPSYWRANKRIHMETTRRLRFTGSQLESADLKSTRTKRRQVCHLPTLSDRDFPYHAYCRYLTGHKIIIREAIHLENRERSGKISLMEKSGKISLMEKSGKISLMEQSGKISLMEKSGKISLMEQSGKISLMEKSGKISLMEKSGKISLMEKSGKISLMEKSGKSQGNS